MANNKVTFTETENLLCDWTGFLSFLKSMSLGNQTVAIVESNDPQVGGGFQGEVEKAIELTPASIPDDWKEQIPQKTKNGYHLVVKRKGETNNFEVVCKK